MRTICLVFGFCVFISTAFADPPSTAPATGGRHWALSIRDPYLRGLGPDNIWQAGRSVRLNRLEVYLDDNLACPYIYEKDGAPYRIDTPEARKTLLEKLTKEHFTIGCFMILPRLVVDGSEDKAVLQRVRKVAEVVSEFGNAIIMLPIDIRGVKENEPPTDQEFVARGKAFVRQLDRIAAETKAQIVIENLGKYWNRPEILEPVLRESTPDSVGLLLDITNMYWYGFPLDRIYELAQQFAPYVRYVHCKNIRYPEDQRQKQRPPGWEYAKYADPIGTGDINFNRIMEILVKAGYVGDLCNEDDSLPHYDAAGKRKALLEDVDFFRQWFKWNRPQSFSRPANTQPTDK